MQKDDTNGIDSTPDDSSEQMVSEFVSYGGELSLSNPGQLELLRGMQERGVPLRTAVRGSSMHPFIRDLDVLTITPLNKRKPRPGEVVAFILPDTGKLAIHRVIKKKESGWLLRGDNCAETDGVVAIENVLGYVSRTERKGKEARLGLKLATGNYLIAWFSLYNLLSPLLKIVYALSSVVRLKREK